MFEASDLFCGLFSVPVFAAAVFVLAILFARHFVNRCRTCGAWRLTLCAASTAIVYAVGAYAVRDFFLYTSRERRGTVASVRLEIVLGVARALVVHSESDLGEKSSNCQVATFLTLPRDENAVAGFLEI